VCGVVCGDRFRLAKLSKAISKRSENNYQQLGAFIYPRKIKHTLKNTASRKMPAPFSSPFVCFCPVFFLSPVVVVIVVVVVFPRLLHHAAALLLVLLLIDDHMTSGRRSRNHLFGHLTQRGDPVVAVSGSGSAAQLGRRRCFSGASVGRGRGMGICTILCCC